jgi:hypothetical protein
MSHYLYSAIHLSPNPTRAFATAAYLGAIRMLRAFRRFLRIKGRLVSGISCVSEVLSRRRGHYSRTSGHAAAPVVMSQFENQTFFVLSTRVLVLPPVVFALEIRALVRFIADAVCSRSSF